MNPTTRPTPADMNVMNAQSMERSSLDAGIISAENLLALADPHLKGALDRWATIRVLPMTLRDQADDLIQRTQMAKAGHPQWTVAAKVQEVRSICREWQPQAEQTVKRLQDAAADWERMLTNATRPPAPTDDPMVLEAQMQGAKQDARMVLDHASDVELADRMGELARGDDPALRYLLLGTPWPDTLFRSRQVVEAPLLWQQVRRQVLSEVLSGVQLRLLERSDALPHVRRAGHALHGGLALFVADNREWFTPEA